jgi:hypothetical protein
MIQAEHRVRPRLWVYTPAAAIVGVPVVLVTPGIALMVLILSGLFGSALFLLRREPSGIRLLSLGAGLAIPLITYVLLAFAH